MAQCLVCKKELKAGVLKCPVCGFINPLLLNKEAKDQYQKMLPMVEEYRKKRQQSLQGAQNSGSYSLPLPIRQRALNTLRGGDGLFVAYSSLTKLPYVTCDEESFNDQVWVFSAEEAVRSFEKKKKAENIPVYAVRYEKKDYGRFYSLLFMIDVNRNGH